MYKRILLPIDGSDLGRRGLKEAIALAIEQKATLCLLHVTSDFPILLEIVNTIDFENYRKGLQGYGGELLEDAKTLASDAGLEVETQLRDLKGGRVAAAIVDEAKKAACDLIVIGTHGRRGLSRALLGRAMRKACYAKVRCPYCSCVRQSRRVEAQVPSQGVDRAGRLPYSTFP